MNDDAIKRLRISILSAAKRHGDQPEQLAMAVADHVLRVAAAYAASRSVSTVGKDIDAIADQLKATRSE